jgi:hypothetical protein
MGAISFSLAIIRDRDDKARRSKPANFSLTNYRQMPGLVRHKL